MQVLYLYMGFGQTHSPKQQLRSKNGGRNSGSWGARRQKAHQNCKHVLPKHVASYANACRTSPRKSIVTKPSRQAHCTARSASTLLQLCFARLSVVRLIVRRIVSAVRIPMPPVRCVLKSMPSRWHWLLHLWCIATHSCHAGRPSQAMARANVPSRTFLHQK